MAGPGFDDPGAPLPTPVGRVRRAFTIGIVLTLVAAIVVLAFVSGRGVVTTVPSPDAPSATTATLATDDSRIAVIDAAGGLSTTDAAGGSVVHYGDPATVFSFPAWSPDGTRIAAVGEGADDSAIYVFTTPAPGATPVEPAIVYRSADRPPFYLYWSPDGRALTFLTTEPDGLALRLAPADASDSATAIREGAPMYWAWADATRMLVHSGGDGVAGFFGEVRADGVATEPAPILTSGFRAPAVSSDGRYRAFVEPGDGTPQRIVVETSDRSDSNHVDVFGVAGMEFAPASAEMAFIAAAEPGRELPLPLGPLRVIDAASGGVRTLLGGSILAFFWAPDGKTIAAIEVPAPGDDSIADAHAVLISTSSGRAAAGTGAKLRISFVDTESGDIRSTSSFTVAALFIDQILPYFDQYALSHRLWSPDGASFAIPVVGDDGTDQVTVIPADGAGAQVVAAGVAGFWSP